MFALPDNRSLRKTTGSLAGKSFSWAYLGQDIPAYHRVRQWLGARGVQLSTTSRFHETAQSLRESYLTYLYDMGSQMGSLRWWISSISHRSPYVSKTFHQACYLKLAMELIIDWKGPDALVLVMADKPVLRALELNLRPGTTAKPRIFGRRRSDPLQSVVDRVRVLALRTFFVLREGGRVTLSRRMIRRPYVPQEPTTLILCWISDRNLQEGQDFHKSFFGDLTSELTKLGHNVAVVPLVARNARYKEAVRLLTAGPGPWMFVQRYLSYLDLIRIAFTTLKKPPLPSVIPPLQGLDVTPLVREDHRTHWVSNQALDALLMVALVRRWAGMGASIQRMVYIYENQPWERALCWQAQRSLPATTMVGYQHARLPRMLLAWYLAQGGEPKAPLPHRIVAVGRHTAELMTSDGYDTSQLQIKVGGALQMQELFDLRDHANGVHPADISPSVLFGLSASFEETAELVEMAIHLFDENEGVRVVIKCHPIMPFESVSDLVGEQLPKHVTVSKEPIMQLMLKSSVMVYSGSTICVQAIALGTPVVYVSPQFDLGMDPLEAVPEARLEASGLEELRERVRWVIHHHEQYVTENRDRWNRLVDEMYTPVTEEGLLAFVE